MEPQRITVDTTLLEKHNLTAAEFIIILAALWKVDLDEAAHNMIRMGTARVELGLVLPNQIAIDRFYATLADSATPQISEEELDDLVQKMKAVYPKGKKPGTDQYWADGPQLLKERLRMFIRKYGEYKAKDILEATQRYVEEMRDNPYMRTLRNFIYKDEASRDGVNALSDLYNYLEHKEEVSDAPQSEWTAQVK